MTVAVALLVTPLPERPATIKRPLSALASRATGKVRDLDIREIQRTLLSQDAILSTHGRSFDDIA